MPCEHCLSQKKTERSVDEKKKLINRLSRIEGQIRGIHMESCVVRDIKNDEADIDELMDIIGKLMK